MIDQVVTTADQRIEAIRAGRESGDAHAVARAAHSLKSSAAIVGARKLQNLATLLEQRAAAWDETTDAPLVDALEATYRETRQILLEELQRIQP